MPPANCQQQAPLTLKHCEATSSVSTPGDHLEDIMKQAKVDLTIVLKVESSESSDQEVGHSLSSPSHQVEVSEQTKEEEEEDIGVELHSPSLKAHA